MKHYDCKHYLSIDAFKGICKNKQINILADDESCKDFEKAEKCTHCSNFKLTGDEIGTCMDKHQAYPQMNANTCADFNWK